MSEVVLDFVFGLVVGFMFDSVFDIVFNYGFDYDYYYVSDFVLGCFSIKSLVSLPILCCLHYCVRCLFSIPCSIQQVIPFSI